MAQRIIEQVWAVETEPCILRASYPRVDTAAYLPVWETVLKVESQKYISVWSKDKAQLLLRK